MNLFPKLNKLLKFLLNLYFFESLREQDLRLIWRRIYIWILFLFLSNLMHKWCWISLFITSFITLVDKGFHLFTALQHNIIYLSLWVRYKLSQKRFGMGIYWHLLLCYLGNLGFHHLIVGSHGVDLGREVSKHFIGVKVLVLEIFVLSSLGHNKVFDQHLEVWLLRRNGGNLLSLKFGWGNGWCRFSTNWGYCSYTRNFDGFSNQGCMC